MQQGDHVFLVDGSGYIFRAYHALPPLTRKSDDLPCGAVSGFCNMLWKLICDARGGFERKDGHAKADRPAHSLGLKGAPAYFAVIFDYSSQTFRKEIYPEYKANRPAPPADLIPQFGLIRAATRAFNLPCIEMEGYEADDILATYARMAEKAGAEVTIVSSDKDLMQLVGPHISLYDSMKNKSAGPAEVEAKWGVPPAQMVDFQALVGDAVDNVPGVSGIGPKTAAELLAKFGSLEAVLAGAAEIPQKKRRETLIEQADQARLSRRLVQLCDTVPVKQDLESLALLPPDGPQLIKFLKAMEFNSLTRRVAAALDIDAAAIEPEYLDVAWPPEGAEAGGGAAAENAAAHGPELPAAGGAEKGAGGGAFLSGQAAAAAPSSYDTGASPRRLAEYAAAQAKAAKIDRSQYVLMTEPKQLADWLQSARAQGFFAFDTETTSLNALQAQLVGFSLALSPGRAAYIPLRHVQGAFDADGQGDLLGGGPKMRPGQMPLKGALDLLKPILADDSVLKIGQNIKYDCHIMAGEGLAIRGFDDTMLMAYVCGAGLAQSFGMDALAAKWLNHQTISYADICGSGKSAISFAEVELAKAAEYAAEDADVTLRLWQVLKPQLTAPDAPEGKTPPPHGLNALYQTEERPLVAVLAAMERRGVLVDRKILADLSAKFSAAADIQAKEIYALAGEEFNIASPKQLGELLFGKFALPGGKKTKTGQWSTSAGRLEELAAQAPGGAVHADNGDIAAIAAAGEALDTGAEADDDSDEAAAAAPDQAQGYMLAGKIVAWRQLKKLQSTYTDALPQFQDAQGRVHTTYAQAATTTGRLASSEPNLQNIPVRTPEGRLIRAAFIAPPGKLLLSADYSQIELRVLAHMADIAALKKAFAHNIDIHAMTASEMFHVPLEQMTPEIRRRAKAINFGIIYGISAFGLANQLGISREEAGQYIKTYFERFPGIQTYMEQTKAFARRHGYVETLFGRRIHYPNIDAKNGALRAFNERAAINAPIQGTAADIIRRAMIKMAAELAVSHLPAQMLLQVHDELIFEVEEAAGAELTKLVAQIMENADKPAAALSVPLKVEARLAKNWDEAH